MTPTSDSDQIRALLLDIEGTTTPIDFVLKTLFPFAAANVERFLREHLNETEIKQIIGELRSTWSGAASAGAPVWIEASPDEKLASAAAYVRWLISRDSKITPLKTLQGKIWEEGYRGGVLKGEVYPDVAPAFARWRGQGRRIAIFSSGSVLAQKLLFAHSTEGDLSSEIEAHFDTTTGAKREPESYQKIAQALGLAPAQTLFLSDVGEELDAARKTGMGTGLARRPGVAPPSSEKHARFSTFAEILP